MMSRPFLIRTLGRCGARTPLCGLLAVTALHAGAQTDNGTASTRGPQSITPSFSATETLTDNRNLSARNKQWDSITQVSPGLHFSSTSGRITGFADYALTGVLRARESHRNEIQHALNGIVKAEVIDDWAFVDVLGGISQQAVSALGTQSSDRTLADGNRAEVTTLTISPYVRGRLASFANYEARVTRNFTSGGGDASGAASTQSSVRLGSEAGGPLGWSLDASQDVSDFSAGRQTETSRAKATLTYAFDPQFNVSVNGGREWTDAESADRQSSSTAGFGVRWLPTERTKVGFEAERRYFGNSHAFTLEHRTPRTVWRASDTRDVSSGFGTSATGRTGTWFDLYYAQFASQVPDPAARTDFVNAFLRQLGLSPTDRATSGALTSALTVQRSQEFSFAWLGVRDTVSFTATQSRGGRADTVAVVADDFSNGNQVRQRGFILSISHRLTPLSSLSLLASQQDTRGSVGNQSTTLRTLVANWSSQLGVRTRVSLGGRRSVFDSSTTPYTESALTADLRLQF